MIKMQAKIQLLAVRPDGNLSTNDDGTDYERNTGTREISTNNKWVGFEHLISWQQLQSTHMTKSGSICMQVQIEEVGIKGRSQSSPPRDPTPDVNVIRCSCCFKNMNYATLFRITYGHLYCHECIEGDLKQRKACVCCDEQVDPEMHQIILLE